MPIPWIWHSPQLKQGDSCFFHHCIDEYLTVLQCLTQCPQAMFILFPYALRYSFSSLCRLHLQCFFQNINACIRIPVMNCMAFRALPDTNAQIFYPWISVAARAAGLTARIHRWYSVKFISIPAGFIFQHFEKLCPGNTCYGFCQFMVPDHSLHVQILDTDGLAIFSCTLATLSRCFPRLWESFCFRESLRCSLMSFRMARSRYLGFDTVFPLLSE